MIFRLQSAMRPATTPSSKKFFRLESASKAAKVGWAAVLKVFVAFEREFLIISSSAAAASVHLNYARLKSLRPCTT